jgi:hypothetical protein
VTCSCLNDSEKEAADRDDTKLGVGGSPVIDWLREEVPMGKLTKLVVVATAAALAFPTAALAKPWWLFYEFEGLEWLQNLMIVLGLALLATVLFVPNYLRKIGKWPEGW